MEKAKRKYASIFELDGIPQMSKALPLALQHVVAMIVGSVSTNRIRNFHIFAVVPDR